MEKKNISLKAILILIGVGIWAIVLQNAGVIPTKQNVYVKGGYIDADVNGSVDVDNTVDVNGYMDVNIDAINGHSRFYDNSSNRGKYFRLPVYTGGN
jgi:hypothetical protein